MHHEVYSTPESRLQKRKHSKKKSEKPEKVSSSRNKPLPIQKEARLVDESERYCPELWTYMKKLQEEYDNMKQKLKNQRNKFIDVISSLACYFDSIGVSDSEFRECITRPPHLKNCMPQINMLDEKAHEQPTETFSIKSLFIQKPEPLAPTPKSLKPAPQNHNTKFENFPAPTKPESNKKGKANANVSKPVKEKVEKQEKPKKAEKKEPKSSSRKRHQKEFEPVEEQQTITPLKAHSKDGKNIIILRQSSDVGPGPQTPTPQPPPSPVSTQGSQLPLPSKTPSIVSQPSDEQNNVMKIQMSVTNNNTNKDQYKQDTKDLLEIMDSTTTEAIKNIPDLGKNSQVVDQTDKQVNETGNGLAD